MSRYEKISQTCLYIGTLMLLMALDWGWYANRYPDGSFVLKLPFIPIIYALFLAVMALCFAAAAYFRWRARPKHTGSGGKQMKSRTGKAC